MWLNIRKLKACRAANSFTLHQGTDQCKHAYVSKSSTERSPSAAASRLPSAATASEQTYNGFTICEVLLITYTHMHIHTHKPTHTRTHTSETKRAVVRVPKRSTERSPSASIAISGNSGRLTYDMITDHYRNTSPFPADTH